MSDSPFNTRSSAGKIVAVTGGLSESIARTLSHHLSGKELGELKIESCMCATSDETAMKVAFNEGVAQGVNSLTDAYEILQEGAE